VVPTRGNPRDTRPLPADGDDRVDRHGVVDLYGYRHQPRCLIRHLCQEHLVDRNLATVAGAAEAVDQLRSIAAPSAQRKRSGRGHPGAPSVVSASRAPSLVSVAGGSGW
jgi:hypothetical protein